ncbi:MAG: Micrococcal nuclease-like protein nuclease [Candidatus Daviesbacteria bacterium GW2011_GWF2_38_6]|uniref:Micrococcal nuclease-like protein nuclease n=1 Tax=Candidatus Daviesbacteria bacterium GW2011_GWF2_38_6 TaxID=1618432 RepID=A0A0G0MZU4_9BACT|nr:MAG: Micrococcal nuclease-like protein nuclease [Candidatus Daviesbacteria bacterium GW2011_GWF2_38_6]
MFQNTKLLIIFTIAILVLGLLFLFSFRGDIIEPVTTEVSKPEITSSGILVTKVIDGDTIEIEGEKRVRLLGVDTPETEDPRKPVQCFGKEASNKIKELLEGKRVILEKDITDQDKYGRLLRFVYLPLEDGTMLFVNDYLIREGYGQVLTIPPDVKFTDQFLEAQKQARMEKKGLWEKCL